MLEPLLTCHALSGAVRPVTPGLLGEIYLAPRTDAWPLAARVADGPAPWTASFAVAPTETALAVERALRALISATASLTPGEVDLARLPQSRARTHLEALQRLWLSLDGALPADLAALAHVLSSDAADALEPLALLDLPADPFASAAETALRARLTAHHGLAPEAASKAWTRRRAALSGGGRPGGSLAHLQASLLAGQVAPLANDGSLAFFGLRDLAQEADFAAALSQALLDDGRADDPAEIGLLVPDEPGYMQHLPRAFDSVGIPLSGAAQENPRRDVAGETLLHTLLALRTPAPSMALASLYLSPLMPWPTDTGQLLAREVMQRRFVPRITKSFTGPAATLFRSLRDGARTNRQLRQRLDTLSACLTEDAPWSDQVRALRRRIAALQARLAATPAEEPAWDDLLRFAVPIHPSRRRSSVGSRG